MTPEEILERLELAAKKLAPHAGCTELFAIGMVGAELAARLDRVIELLTPPEQERTLGLSGKFTVYGYGARGQYRLLAAANTSALAEHEARQKRDVGEVLVAVDPLP